MLVFMRLSLPAIGSLAMLVAGCTTLGPIGPVGVTGAPPARTAPQPQSPPPVLLPPPPPPPAEVPPPEPVAVEEEAPPEPAGPCPPEMALIKRTVCVDRWEAHLVEVGGTGVHWSPYLSPSKAAVKLRAVSEPGVVPQGYINGDEARAACAASGKRLCSVWEWETACRGPHRTLYPYGDTRMKGTCNDDGRKRHPVIEANDTLGLPKDRMWYEGMRDPIINQLERTLTKTGERAECTNEYGAFDMVGNLHEWIDDPEGTFRGGFYMDTLINGEGCSYETTAHATTYADYSTGFRCCRTPSLAR
jgi:sulfatase modifying factor 1